MTTMRLLTAGIACSMLKLSNAFYVRIHTITSTNPRRLDLGEVIAYDGGGNLITPL
jgi:hypothetical protein